MKNSHPLDRIYPVTRILGAVVIPFLALAVLILYFFPDQTGQRFAWPVKPPLTAMLMAAAYAGGIYFFSFVVFGRHWHRVKLGFLPVTTFASLLGIATILHWDKFTPGHIAFILWAGLYFSTPFLVFAAWLYNRREDPGSEQVGGPLFSAGWRYFFALQAIGTLILGVGLFLTPVRLVPAWPWTLTPLTAQVMGALFAIPGVLAIEIVIEPHWKPAQRLLEAQFVSFLLILGGLLRSRADFKNVSVYVGFIAAVGAILLALVVLFIQMGAQSRKPISDEHTPRQDTAECDPC